MQHILVVGLDNLGDERTQKLAQSWAQRWTLGNYLAYKETGAMYEKVNFFKKKSKNLGMKNSKLFKIFILG